MFYLKDRNSFCSNHFHRRINFPTWIHLQEHTLHLCEYTDHPDSPTSLLYPFITSCWFWVECREKHTFKWHLYLASHCVSSDSMPLWSWMLQSFSESQVHHVLGIGEDMIVPKSEKWCQVQVWEFLVAQPLPSVPSSHRGSTRVMEPSQPRLQFCLQLSELQVAPGRKIPVCFICIFFTERPGHR